MCICIQRRADDGWFQYASIFVKNEINILCRKPICRHEPLLSGTTDADQKFPALNTTKLIDGREYVGVFSTDLTLEQVKTLRAIQPNPLRSKRFDGKFEVCC
jgi:hypothetical protein